MSSRLLACVFVVVNASLASAQTELYLKVGPANGDKLGESIDSAGDVDGDGRADLIHGVPGGNCPTAPGYVEIVSPSTGAVLRRWDDDQVNGHFGAHVANVGDYDGDGEDDFAISSNEFVCGSFQAGRVRVYSAVSGGLLADLSGSTYGATSFGTSVDGIGDLDGDGRTELVIGAWPTAGDGRAVVISSIDSSVLHVFDGANLEDGLGFVVCAVGDVDGDLAPDFAIAAPQFHFAPGPGYVEVRSGATGALLHRFEGNGGIDGKDFFGRSMAPLGDVDGDGVCDLVVGAIPGTFPGYARVFSLATGAQLYELTEGVVGDSFGFAVSGVGDVEGDGRPDIAVANVDERRVHVYSGRTGAELYGVTLPPSQQTIMALTEVGAVDGDGFADYAVGTRQGTGNQVGRISVRRGFDCPVTVYCTAKANSLGCVPTLSFVGAPSVGAGSGFTIQASGVLNNKLGSFFFSLAGQQAVPFLGGTLCVMPPIKRTGIVGSGGNPPPNDCSGSYSIDFNAYVAASGNPNLIVGATIDGQFWSRDPGFSEPNNSGLTEGVHFTLCP